MAANVYSLLEANLQRQGARPALVWHGGQLSREELHARVGGCARALAGRGIRAGDRVAIRIGNDPRPIVALLASLKLGATVSPLNPLLKTDERAQILADFQPAAVVEDPPAETAEWPTTTDVSGPALVLYTSGSTGRPKGAVLSHAAVAGAIRSWAEPVMGLTGDDVVLSTLPLAHSYGLNGTVLAPVLAGATIALLERFSPDGALEAIERHGVSVFPGVATMFRRLLDSRALTQAAVSSLRIALSGAAPCPWELAEEWRERTGVRILRGYGMTELFRPISFRVDDPRDLPEAIGRPVPGVEVRLVDEEGRDVPPGAVGELLIRSPCAMDGYLNAPGLTREVLVDGWFVTGDLASQTPDGFICIAGRKRELILRGGYSVFPPEIERVLSSHPAVSEAAVVGQPDAELGEEVVAFVALRGGETASPEALVAYCRERLAGYKYPRRVHVVERLPRGPSGKVRKTELSAGAIRAE